MKKVLSIAGSDCSGGAGIQADLKTFSAHGVFGMTVVTSVVAENSFRVIEYQDIRPDIIEMQIDAIFEDMPPDAVKIGMLSCIETMQAVSKKLREYKPINVVIDPVMYAKNGCALMDMSAIETLIEEIIPQAAVITPNIPEAEHIAEMSIITIDDMKVAARKLQAMGCHSVIIKGGHKEGDATDVLFDGQHYYEFASERIDSKHTHGTGCTFSSAIASNLALGQPINLAVEKAKKYINTAIINAPGFGKGNGPLHHFYELYKQLNLG